jgi:hypothetical protein
MSNAPHSLSSIHKASELSKRTVLPKASLIQIYLDSQNQQQQQLQNGILSTSNKCKVLPKFSNQDILNHINLMNNEKTIDLKQFNVNNQLKKTFKDKKFKEITRLCLTSNTNQASCINLGTDKTDSQEDGTNEAAFTKSKSQENVIKFLAKEFLSDCKQRLDSDSFRRILKLLKEFESNEFKNEIEIENKDQIDSTSITLSSIYEIIKTDSNLLNKFSAFITPENSLKYDLHMQTLQYEKCIALLNKLELFVPNKSAFKKLIQSIIVSSTEYSDQETTRTKIEELKAKINMITKNNPLIIYELDYLFDQRNVNLQPVYEEISLVDSLSDFSKQANDSLNEQLDLDPSIYLNEELIDLSEQYPIDYGSKKCSCHCHLSNTLNLNSEQQLQQSTQTEEFNAQALFNHCLTCCLKLIKGKLYVKCEGKKAIPLAFKLN